MTSFNPLPAHLQAVQEEFAPGGGMSTPSYGGTVTTGLEWDFVSKDGRKSRTPSRSPQRAHTDSRLPSSHHSSAAYSPSPLSGQPSGSSPASNHHGHGYSHSPHGQQPPSPTSAAAYAAQNRHGQHHTPPHHRAAAHHEPTINEEAAAHVARSVALSQGVSVRDADAEYRARMREREGRVGASAPVRNGVNGTSGSAATGRGESSSNTAQAQAQGKSRSRMVGEWQLQKTLGAGSMGKVKLATNVHTKEKCAVKIIPRYSEATRREEPKSPEEAEKQRLKDESKEVRTIREAAISLLLHHPYICGMREFITHTNHHYMITEFIDGGQMLDYIISHGRLRERAARKFARQIGSALEYCHKNNIVHRDLKIENILISKNGNIKIIDFGLSNLFAPDRHLSTFCGSLYFAAPELLNAKVYTGPEVDVWSFGIVLYVLVCGKVPFDDQSMPALHAKIKRGLVEYPAWLSNECKAVLSRMLVTNPAERANLTEVMNHPFMTKGYEGPPESHLILREPLRAEELDWEVINAMGGFTFGNPEQIYEELRTVLSSEQYFHVVQAWDARRDRKRVPAGGGNSSSSMTLSEVSDSPKKKRFSGFDFKKKLFREEKKVEDHRPAEKEPLDPTRGYDPLISIYFLAREKMERERVYGRGHFASSQTSVDGSHGRGDQTSTSGSGFGMAIPSLTVPPSSHAMAYEPPSSIDFGPTPTPRERTNDVPNPVMQHPAADAENSHIADLPNVHKRQPSLSNPPTPLQPSLMQMEDSNRKFNAAQTSRQPSRSDEPAAAPMRDQVVPSPSMPLEYRKGATIGDKKHDRRVSVGSISNSMGRLGRRSSQNWGVSGRRSPEKERGWLSDQKEEDDGLGGSGRRREPTPSNNYDLNDEPGPEPEPEAEVEPDVKSVYLKGLFSVSTTSTKPASVLTKDITSVLDRIGIKYRPIRGGFECVHVPSIVLGSVMAEATTSLNHVPNATSTPAQSLGKTGRKPSLRRKKSKNQLDDSPGSGNAGNGVGLGNGIGSDRSRGPSPSPNPPSASQFTRGAGGGSSGTFSGDGGKEPSTPGRALTSTPHGAGTQQEDDVDAWALAAGGGVGGKMIVRFEISVVKVPWLPLHGIQFRRISGDGWAYQQLAKTVLKEMRL